MRYLSSLYLIVVSSLVVSSISAIAAPPPSAEELRKALIPGAKSKPRSASNPNVGFRGITITETEPAAAPPSVQLQQISFEYNSAKLTKEARLTLDNLATAMEDPTLKESRFKLTGHTDSIGGAEFNLTLSVERAQSALDYLTRQHHIDAARLSIEGKGFSELADSQHPEAAVNRRVQVTNLGHSE